MTHDEMCPRKTWEADPWGDHCAVCELIGRVREEWYEVQSETWSQGYEYALKEARDAVAAISREQMLSMDASAWLLRSAVLAAIDGLAGEQP